MSKKVVKQEIQCCVWDFTSYETELSVDEIKTKLNKICKKYCFQLEKGEENGKLHWQGRISLKEKLRQGPAAALINKEFKCHISRTSTDNKNNDFYVMKEDTRIKGPFKDTDIIVPRDVRDIKELYPWQNKMDKHLESYEPRMIDIIIDEEGNNGKTLFTRYEMCYKGAQLLPLANDYKDILRMCMNVGPKKIYLIDMPRAISKEKLYQFYAAIESIKGGFAYDDRYEYKQMLFDPPRICVFTNKCPDLKLLTRDRWNLWTIHNNKLKKYSVE